MVVLHVTVVIRPEERERWLGLLDALIPPSRSEAACHRYDVYESIETPDTFLFHEEWETLEDFYAHNNTPHVTEFFSGLAAVVAQPPEGTISELSSTIPLTEALESAGISEESAEAFRES
jgi:quinol monooxygenase YgiN